jgi:hypothetical protein
MKKDLESLKAKLTHVEMKIFEPQNPGSNSQFDKVSESAKEPII